MWRVLDVCGKWSEKWGEKWGFPILHSSYWENTVKRYVLLYHYIIMFYYAPLRLGVRGYGWDSMAAQGGDYLPRKAICLFCFLCGVVLIWEGLLAQPFLTIMYVAFTPSSLSQLPQTLDCNMFSCTRRGTSRQGHFTILLSDQAWQVHNNPLKSCSVNDDEVAHPGTVFKPSWCPIAHKHKL